MSENGKDDDDGNIKLIINTNGNPPDENEKNNSKSRISINNSESLISSESDDVELRMERLINIRRQKLLSDNSPPRKMTVKKSRKSFKHKSLKQNEEEKANPNGEIEMTKDFLMKRIENKKSTVKKEEEGKNEETKEKNEYDQDDNFIADDDADKGEFGENQETQLLEYDKFYKELFFKNEVFKFDAKFKDKEEEAISQEEEKLKLKNLIKSKTKIRDVAAVKGQDTTKMDKELKELKEHYQKVKNTKVINLDMNMNNTEGLLYKGTLLNNYFSDLYLTKMPKFSIENERDMKGKEIIDFKPVDKDEMIRRFWDPCCCLRQRKKIYRCLTYSQFYAGFVVDNFIFDWISLFVIIVNTACILVSDPRDDNSIQNTSDTYFLVFYTLECILKILGFGFIFTERAYLKDYWNILDFLVILVGWVSFFLEFMTEGTKITGLAALRAFRILRPLKTVKSVKGLRRLIIALLASLAKLKDITIVLFAFFLLFAIGGVQMWTGNFKRRCMSVNYGYMYSLTGTTAMCTFDTDCDVYNEPGNTFICAKGWKNPNNGVITFDNTLLGFVTIFVIATLEGWTTIFVYVSLTFKDKIYINPIINFLFFHFFVFAGGFYLINLFLAVTNSEFTNIDRVKKELITRKSLYKLMKASYDLREKEKEEKKRKDKELQAKAKRKNIGENIYDLKEKIVDDAFHITKNVKDIPLTYTTIKDIYILSGNNPQELYSIDKAIDKEEDYLCDNIDKQLDDVEQIVNSENDLDEEKDNDEETKKLNEEHKNNQGIHLLFQDIDPEHLQQSEKLTFKFMQDEAKRRSKKVEKVKIISDTNDSLKKKLEKREMEKFNMHQVVMLDDLSFEKEQKDRLKEELNKVKIVKKDNLTPNLAKRTDIANKDENLRNESRKQTTRSVSRKHVIVRDVHGKEKLVKNIEEELSFIEDLSVSSEDDEEEKNQLSSRGPLNHNNHSYMKTKTIESGLIENDLSSNLASESNNKDKDHDYSVIAEKNTQIDRENNINNEMHFSRPGSNFIELLGVKYDEKFNKKLAQMRKNFRIDKFLEDAKEDGLPVKNLGRRRSFLKFIQYTQDEKNSMEIWKGIAKNQPIKIKENDEENEQSIEEEKSISLYSKTNEISAKSSDISELSKLSVNFQNNNQIYEEDININEINKKLQLNKVTNYAKKIFLDKNSKNSAANMNTNKMKKFYEKVNKNMNENIIIDMKEPRGRAIEKENVSHVYIAKPYDFDNDDPDLMGLSRSSKMKVSARNTFEDRKKKKNQNMDILRRNYSINNKDKDKDKDLDANLKKEDRTVGVYKTQSVGKSSFKYPKIDTMKDMVEEENKKMSTTLDPRQELISVNWRSRRFYMNYLYNIKEKDLKVKDNFKIDQWRGEIMGREENVIPRKKLPESTEAEFVFNDKNLNLKKYKFLYNKPFEWMDEECAYITNELKNLPFNCLEIMPIRIRDFGKYYVGKEINLGVLSNVSNNNTASASAMSQGGETGVNYSASAMSNKSRSNFCAASSFGIGKKVKDDFKTKKLFYDKFYKSLDTFNYRTLTQYYLDEEKLYFKMTDDKHREDRAKVNEENIKSKEKAIEVKTEIKNVKIFDLKSNTSRYIQWSGADVLYKQEFASDESIDKYNSMIESLENFRVIIWIRAPGFKELQKIRYGLYLISTNTVFDLFIMGLVLGNAIVMALDGNTFTPEKYSDISISNYVFNGIFIAEFVIKLIGLGPIIYFSDAFTYLDLVIIAFAIFDMVQPSDSSGDTIGSSKKLTSRLSFLRVFRIFRVLRLTKILRRMKSMKLIITSIKKSLADVAYIVLILIMFTIIFQLLGMSLMNGNIRYQSFLIAFYTTFQILTTENWNNIFYTLYALNKFTFIYYLIWIFLGNYILFNLFISILLQSFSSDNGNEEDEDDLEDGEILERMFGLPEYLLKLKDIENESKNRQIGVKVKKSTVGGTMTLDSASASSSKIRASQSAMSEDSENFSSTSENEEIDEKELADEDDNVKASGVEKNMKSWKKIDELFKRNECETSLYFLSQVNSVRIWCMRVVSGKIFEIFILLVILFSTARLIADTILEGYFWVLFFDMIDLAFNMIFLAEMILKIIALGLIMDEGSYLRDNWNKIDFVIVIVSLIDIKSLTDKYIKGNSNASNSLNFFKVLRLLRTLRTLRIISHNVQLKLIITSLFDSIIPITNALIMVLVVFFMFSIVGINLFYSSYHNCYVPGKDTPFKTADSKFSDYLFQYDVSTTMPAIENFCVTRYNGIMDTGPKFKFTNIGISLITSYVLGNMEGWPDIMNDYRVFNEYYGIFFIVYLLVVSYFFLNIFTGIMFRYFNEAWSREQKLPEDDIKACKYFDFLNQIVDADPEYATYLTPEPGTLKWFLVSIANSSFLDNFIMLIIFLNMIVMAINFDDCTDWYETLLDTLNLIFTSIFIAECVLKISALGPICYFYVGWNQFDFFVVVASIADLIIGNIGTINASFLKSFQIIRVLRVLRITRVLRLVKSLKSLEKLIQTLRWSISALANVFVLMFILFCIFATLGCYLYEAIQYDDYKDDLYYLNEYYNFDNFYYSFLLTFKCCTGEDWPSIMYELAFVDIDAVSTATAYGYMIVVNFLSAIIMLNLFLMVTLQQYDEFTSKSYNPVEMFENFMESFKISWNKNSKGEENGRIIPKNLIINFFNELSWKKLNFPENNKLEAIKKYVSDLKLVVDNENYVYFHDVLLKIVVFQMGSKVDRTVAANAIIFKQEKKVVGQVKKLVNNLIKRRYRNTKTINETFNPLTSHLYFKISFLFMKTYVSYYKDSNKIIEQEEDEVSESENNTLVELNKNPTMLSKAQLIHTNTTQENNPENNNDNNNSIKVIDNNITNNNAIIEKPEEGVSEDNKVPAN